MRGLIRKGLATLAADQRGATALEYGLILALVVIAMAAALGPLGDATGGMWAGIRDKLAGI